MAAEDNNNARIIVASVLVDNLFCYIPFYLGVAGIFY